MKYGQFRMRKLGELAASFPSYSGFVSRMPDVRPYPCKYVLWLGIREVGQSRPAKHEPSSQLQCSIRLLALICVVSVVQLKQTTITYHPPSMVAYEMEGKTVGQLAVPAGGSMHALHVSCCCLIA